MTEEITKAYHAWLAGLERGRTIDVEMAFAAGYETSATLKTLQAWQAGYQNGECQMWQRVRDIVDERVRTYVLRQDGKDALAENSLNQHEMFRHTREAMDLLADLIASIAPKKTLNFETGIAPAEAKEEEEVREEAGSREETGHAALRAWDLDMTTAPRDGTIVEVVGRYPGATAGFPRYAGYSREDDAWFEYSRHAPERVIPWAWRHRTDWPDEPKRKGP